MVKKSGEKLASFAWSDIPERAYIYLILLYKNNILYQ